MPGTVPVGQRCRRALGIGRMNRPILLRTHCHGPSPACSDASAIYTACQDKEAEKVSRRKGREPALLIGSRERQAGLEACIGEQHAVRVLQGHLPETGGR